MVKIMDFSVCIMRYKEAMNRAPYYVDLQQNDLNSVFHPS